MFAYGRPTGAGLGHTRGVDERDLLPQKGSGRHHQPTNHLQMIPEILQPRVRPLLSQG